MEGLTPLAVTTLGLLTEGPKHPYEIVQTLLKRREDRNVKIRPGSLYHTVDRLAASGDVRPVGTGRDGRRPERTTYEITPSGRERLRQRVTDMLATPVHEYPELPVAIAQAHALAPDTVAALCERRLAIVRAEIAELETLVEDLTARGIVRIGWLDLLYRRSLREAERDFLDALVDDIASGRLTWTPAAPAAPAATPQHPPTEESPA